MGYDFLNFNEFALEEFCDSLEELEIDAWLANLEPSHYEENNIFNNDYDFLDQEHENWWSNYTDRQYQMVGGLRHSGNKQWIKDELGEIEADFELNKYEHF